MGNDRAIEAYRQGKKVFPDGSVIARLAWNYVPSSVNNKVFGREQSFVAGSAPDWHLQFMVKDSERYAASGGWGYAQFNKDGTPVGQLALGNSERLVQLFRCAAQEITQHRDLRRDARLQSRIRIGSEQW